jgi:hypothetical protein
MALEQRSSACRTTSASMGRMLNLTTPGRIAAVYPVRQTGQARAGFLFRSTTEIRAVAPRYMVAWGRTGSIPTRYRCAWR